MIKSEPRRGQAYGKIHALTSLRFFAALFVVFFHTIWMFFPTIRPHVGLGKLFNLGYVSVSFFFLLSGYILAYVYLRHAKTISISSFYRARLARIYPLLFLTLILDSPFLIFDKIHTYGVRTAILKSAFVFAGSAALLQAWIPQLKAINSPSWSLSVEAVFYLLFPILGIVIWRLRGVALWLVAATLYFGGQLLVLIASSHMSVDFVERLPLLHLSTFALGILLARWQEFVYQVRSRNARDNTFVYYTLLLICILCFTAIVLWSPASSTITDCLCDGMLAPVFAGLIWIFSNPNFVPAKALSASWMVVLGEASYGLYLFHAPVMHLFGYLGLARGPVLFSIYLITSVFISIFSFYCFETPARKWIVKQSRIHVKETMEIASDV